MRSRDGSANAPTPSCAAPGNDVLLLELAAGLEEDQRDLEREVVLQLGADMLVGALGVASHPLQVRLDLGVVVDLEVIGGVDAPLEVVVADLVLAEIRDVGRLRGGERRRKQDGDRKGGSHREQGPAPCAVAHVSSPRRVGVSDALPCRGAPGGSLGTRDLTVTF